MEKFECVSMSRDSKLGIVFASSQEVCVGKGLVALSTLQRSCVMYSLATVDMFAPCYLI